MKGQGLNFMKIRDQVYAQLASTIANDIDRLWADDWDMDVIILTGGGCMELAKYLQPLISGRVMPVENNVDARLNNVQGYLKYGRFIWKDTKAVSEPPQPPPPPAEELEPIEEEPEPIQEEAPLVEAEMIEEPEPLEEEIDDETLMEIEELVDENLSDKP